MLTPGVWVPEWLLTVVLPDSSHSASSNRPSWSGDDFSLEEPKRLQRICGQYCPVLKAEIFCLVTPFMEAILRKPNVWHDP